jgi:hypothetical protein
MIPLYIFLFIWLAFLGLYGLMSLVSVYQLMRYGIAQTGTWVTTVVFSTVALLVVLGAGSILISVDWNQSLNLFGTLSLSAPSYLQ